MNCRNCNQNVHTFHLKDWCINCVIKLVEREEMARANEWRQAWEAWGFYYNNIPAAAVSIVEAQQDAFKAGWSARGLPDPSRHGAPSLCLVAPGPDDAARLGYLPLCLRSEGHKGGHSWEACKDGEPMMHGPKPYRWCTTHDYLMLRCEAQWPCNPAGDAEVLPPIEDQAFRIVQVWRSTSQTDGLLRAILQVHQSRHGAFNGRVYRHVPEVRRANRTAI